MRTLIFSLCVASLVMVFCDSGKALHEFLVLGFTFDEGRGNTAKIGTVVKDSSPAQNNGKIEGGDLKWVDGKFNRAIRFDANGYIEVPHSETLNLKKAHTISYWLKWDGQGADWSPFISKGVGEAAMRRAANNFTTWIGKDGMWTYDNLPHGLRGKAVADGRVPLSRIKWTYFALTHDGKDKISFYINGDLHGETKLKVGFVNKHNVRVGDDGKDHLGAGAIDELGIFNKALTEEEIKELMNKSKFAVEPTTKLATTWGHIKNSF